MGGGLGVLLAMDVYEMIAWIDAALEYQSDVDKDLSRKLKKAKKKGFG